MWGPYRQTTYFGCTTFQTIVHDYTRATWVYFLQAKSECVKFLQQFTLHAHTKHQSIVQVVMSKMPKRFVKVLF